MRIEAVVNVLESPPRQDYDSAQLLRAKSENLETG
jgi:hypothetical protein